MADKPPTQTTVSVSPTSREQLEEGIRIAIGKRPVGLKAQTYRNKKWSSASCPVLLACSDGQEYVVKGRQNGKMIANEQIVGTLARKLGAPVPEVKLIEVPDELIAANPDMQHMQAGLAHGSLSLLPDCTERVWLDHAGLPGNRSRFALLAVLYGWVQANDHQLVYRKIPPELVFSIDHGHFFNGGPAWTVDTLSQAGRAAPDAGILQGCQITEEERFDALRALESLDSGSVIEAVAMPPDEWQLTLADRVAAAQYLLKRRQELIVSRFTNALRENTMPAFYTVVQYVPDPVIDERMNIGVIVFGDGRLRTRFLENWQRVRSFGGENISFIRTFIKDLERMGEEDIRRVAETCQHSIQLTRPAGSVLTPDKLLVDVSSRYLRGLTPPEKTYRTRQDAIALTRRTVREALDQRLGKQAKGLVKVDYPIQGKFGSHQFDVGAGNGRPFFAARALSFEKPQESKVLDREIEATAFAVSDVRNEEDSIPLGVVVLPPKKDNRETYEAAVRVFQAVEALVIEDSQLDKWAEDMAEKVSSEWLHD